MRAMGKCGWYAVLCGVLWSLGIGRLGAEDLPAPSVPPTIFLVGDSTMATQDPANGNPGRGWGQLLPEYVAPGTKVVNTAKGGRSTRSFRDEGLWDAMLNSLQPGDWVIIQFGHNDQKKDKPAHYADASQDFPAFMKRYVAEVLQKGARPVLVTPIYRRHFRENGEPKSTAGAYPEATRLVAAEMKVPLVDLHELTKQLIADYGVDGSKELFLHFRPGEIPFFPEGKEDNSHLSEKGARQVAGLFAKAVKAQGIPLAELLQK